MCESNGPESHQGTTVHRETSVCGQYHQQQERFCPCKEPGGNGGQRALRDSPRTKIEGADSGQSIKVDYVKRKASKRRLSLHSELASAWEKGAGSIIHGSNPEESWSPDREYWYNSLTGAVSYSSVSPRETHIDSTRNSDLAASKAGAAPRQMHTYVVAYHIWLSSW